MASLAMRKDLLDQVILPNQSFVENYKGSFKFRFWHFGKWHKVKIDDFLPVKTKYGEDKLMFVKSTSPNEFWSPLVEKAYAKMNGGYKVIRYWISSFFVMKYSL